MKKIVMWFGVWSLCMILAGCQNNDPNTSEGKKSLPKATAASQNAERSGRGGKKKKATADYSKAKLDTGFYSKDKEKVAAWLKKYPARYDSEKAAYQEKVLLFGYQENRMGKEALEEFLEKWQECWKEKISYQQSIVVFQLMKRPEICVCGHLKHLLLHRKSDVLLFAVVIMRIVTLILAFAALTVTFVTILIVHNKFLSLVLIYIMHK